MLLTTEQIACLRKAILTGELKVVPFDLETSISQFYGFASGKQYVDAKSLVPGTETQIMSAQYMDGLTGKAQAFTWESHLNELGEFLSGILPKAVFQNIPSKFNRFLKTYSDANLVKNLVPLINNADIIIGQNSDSFDIKTLQDRAKAHGLPPVTVQLSIDILKNSRKAFRRLSHSLDFRSKQYGLGGKHRMERADWTDIVEGKTTVEDKMLPYGLKDVADTVKVFLRELPYYNFSKTQVSSILRLINWEKKNDFCPYCAEKRQSKFNVFRKGKFLHCNNCEQKFVLEK